MNVIYRIKTILALAVMALALLCSSASAELSSELGILDLTANGGINPATGALWEAGDTYRLVFASSTTIDATSTDIAVYNAQVQSAANAAGLGSVTWNAIGSTAAIDARDNTGTNPSSTGVAIFMMNGVTIAGNNNADMWDGHDGTIDIKWDENGDPVRTDLPVGYGGWGPIWTGTNGDGTGSSLLLGNVGSVTMGLSYHDGGSQWVARGSADGTEQRMLYGLSEPLTVAGDQTLPDVDAGSDWVTWSGADLTLSDVNVVNNSDPVADLTFGWSADPEDGVVFDSNTIEFPTITITKATDNPSVVTLTLVVNNAGSDQQDVTDTMDIEVYDDFCEAAKGVGGTVSFESSDINRDCITDLRDFAELAALWLVDYALTGAAPKNGVAVDYDGNFKIDLADFAVLASTWGNGSDADDLAELVRRWLDVY